MNSHAFLVSAWLMALAGTGCALQTLEPGEEATQSETDWLAEGDQAPANAPPEAGGTEKPGLPGSRMLTSDDFKPQPDPWRRAPDVVSGAPLMGTTDSRTNR